MERILIVEDSPTQREMLSHTLRTHGYDVVTANNGRDAWDRLAAIAPTLVLTDILMPEMDGYALCRAMKESTSWRPVPVVLLTSLSDPKDVVAALECGADGFIGKPFADEYLLSRVAAVFENRNLPDRDKREKGVEIRHAGRTYLISAERPQILDLVLSVYEVAMLRNADLAEAQATLRKLNADLEQKVRDRTRKLEESNQSLETFCYSVAHDLRAPLRSIQGFVGMLSELNQGPHAEEMRGYIERAMTAAGRMDKMIIDLLAYGRVSHADIPLGWVTLRSEVERIIAEFADEIERKKARIDLEIDDVRILTSRVLLAQIVSNLLANALKFVEPGESPHVTIRARATATEVRLDVADRGIGIDLQYRDKIFKVFEKLHTAPFPGTGIGLAIVQKAAERLGGTITVDSTPGQGSRFTLTLPVAGPAAG